MMLNSNNEKVILLLDTPGDIGWGPTGWVNEQRLDRNSK